MEHTVFLRPLVLTPKTLSSASSWRQGLVPLPRSDKVGGSSVAGVDLSILGPGGGVSVVAGVDYTLDCFCAQRLRFFMRHLPALV